MGRNEQGGVDRIWACSCPLCRGVVYPVLRRLLRGLRIREKLVEEVKEVSEEQGEEYKHAETEELKNLVEALKNSIMELRSAISDLTSPFNLMRQAAEKEELKAIREAAEDTGPVPFSASPAAVPIATRPAGPQPEVAVARPKEVVEEKPKERVERVVPPKPSIEEMRPAERREVPLIKALRLLRLLYTLRGKLSSHNIENLVQLLVVMGAIDEGMANTVRQMLSLVEEGMRSGLSPEDQAVIIYSLAKTLGVEDEEFEEEVASILLKRLGGGGIWGSQQQ